MSVPDMSDQGREGSVKRTFGSRMGGKYLRSTLKIIILYLINRTQKSPPPPKKVIVKVHNDKLQTKYKYLPHFLS